MNKPDKQRSSNIELLRVLATCGVIILHYNNPAIGGAVAVTTGISHWILVFLECLSVNAVNIFVMISGYFMCKSNERNLLKPLELILQVMLIKEACYLISCFLKNIDLTATSVINALIPSNWFVILYVVLYFISPYLNLLMETLKKKNAQKQFILVLFIIFSAVTCGLDVLQSVTPLEFTGMSPIGAYGSQFGYTIVTFVLVYLIGAWLRDTEIRGSFLRLALYLILLFGWAYLERGTEFIYMFCWSYCNPLIILLAAELLLLFRRLPIGNKSWINLPAKASFTVYLVHLFIIPYLRIGEYADRGLFILLAHLAVSVIGVYLLCFIVWFVYEQVITRLIRATLGKTALSHNLYKNL